MEDSTGTNAAHLQLLQAAIYALFETSQNKPALRREFAKSSEAISALQLNYPISDAALATVQLMRQALLDLLE